jgi:hypothetical protein
VHHVRRLARSEIDNPRKEFHMPSSATWPLSLIVACALLSSFLLTGCDQLSERAGFPDPVRLEAEGKAIGGACRHAGRGLEDCYRLNKDASKPAIYAGWKEMNEYMMKNNMQSVTPTFPPEALAPRKKRKVAEEKDKEADSESKTEKEAAAEGKTEADKKTDSQH